MQCPYCTDQKGMGYKTEVLDTRNYFDTSRRRFYTQRRRVCTHCQTKFKTLEFSPILKEPKHELG